MCTQIGSSEQTQFVESAENPNRSVILEGEVLRQPTAPLVVHDHRRAALRSLHHRFRLTSIAVGAAIRQKDIDGRPIITIATPNEGEGGEKTANAILRNPPPEQIPSYGLGEQHFRKQESKLWEKLQMVESDDTRTVNDA